MAETWTDDGWRISDELWALIEPLIPPPPKVHPWGAGVHKSRTPNRQVLDAIFFQLRTGCQWNALSATGLGASSTVHRRFQEWEAAGFFQALWKAGLLAYDEAVGIEWDWQAMDGALHKAPLGGKKNRPQSDGSGQKRGETQPADRRTRRAARDRGRGGERQ
jgi:transposase